MSEPRVAALDALPAELQVRLEAIGAGGRGPFGRRSTQSIVAEHLDILLTLQQAGASHADLAAILHLLGIATRTGDPLSAGALSSAISRAQAVKRPSSPNASRRAARPDAARRSPAREHKPPPPLQMPVYSPASEAPPSGIRSDPPARAPAPAGANARTSPRDGPLGAASVRRAGEILNLLDEEKG
jgi:hypothetical protein